MHRHILNLPSLWDEYEYAMVWRPPLKFVGLPEEEDE